ncbi:thiol-disulfide oxidoreductase DCC family protein [Streptomyces sp. TR06-5]|uniref:thiol-disulfide oxidoreductase DCC family protein n=1 Tax=unclassified Streptomyces TaxID=2593676 RepID=UPI0039A1549A
MTTTDRPGGALLVYDGDCGFCATAVGFVERRMRPRCTFVPWQFTDLDALGVTEHRVQHEMLWVTPAGTVFGGAEAAAMALLRSRGAWPVAGAVLSLPVVRWIARGVYRLVATNRHRLPGGTPACAVRPPAAGGPGRSPG